MHAYKVVRRDNWRLISYTSYWPLEYAAGQKTVPATNFGPLCAFIDLEDAYDWFQSMTTWGEFELELWSCEVEESDVDSVWRPSSCGRMIEELPDGTILCDSITLLERIS